MTKRKLSSVIDNELNATQLEINIASCSYEGSLFTWKADCIHGNAGSKIVMNAGFNCCQGSLKALSKSANGSISQSFLFLLL